MIKLYKGDCLDIMETLISQNIKVDTIICDPPYEISPGGGGENALAQRATKMRDSIEFIANGFDYERTFKLMLNICKIPNMLIFCSNNQISKTMKFFEDKGLTTTLLIWDKTNPAPLCYGRYVNDLEFIVYVHTKGSIWNQEAPYKYKLKCKQYPIVVGSKSEEKIHPTQKPVDLIEELVELHSLKGGTILDCFMGSGSTGIACINTDRNFIGIERDEIFFSRAVKRFKNNLPMFKQKDLTIIE